MSRPALARLAGALILATIALPAVAADDPDPAVTPYRPSVSSPAALSTPGWVEMETGGLYARGPDAHSSRFSVPLTLKLAFTPDLGVVLGGEAWVRDVTPGPYGEAKGRGDTTLVLKQRFGLDEHRAFGLELGTKFPTAAQGVGSGERDWSANGIYSADVGEAWHTDVNLNETLLGAPGRLPPAWQAGWAASLSRSLNDDWGAVGELSGTRVTGEKGTVQVLFAGSYNASKAAVLDFGFAKGMNRITPHAQVFVGGTFRLGRLF